ncbi:MAG: phosphoribosylglycinamide formyltransferase [Legionellales bacterium]|nr:phosphoribosylglycinamide formyltransferase [Legionellales bacterium]|tara:strand:+ start:956 stop:1633 length:678 start_codon:yes stop_codon:yes gene_type:complete
MKRLAVFLSGRGSNFEALLEATINSELKGVAQIVVVHSNKPAAGGLNIARAHGIPSVILEPKQFADRPTYETALIEALAPFQCDLVCLAGYMRILSQVFVREYAGRILNIHPSLLPKYPGLHTHEQVLTNRDKEHGATVHFVIDALDAGPKILQSKVSVLPNDTVDELSARVLEKEHILYARAVKWFCEDRLKMDKEKAVLDGKPLLFDNDYNDTDKDIRDDSED